MAYDDSYQDQRPPYSGRNADDGIKILRFEMYDTLLPNGDGLAYTIDWDPVTEVYVKSTRRRRVYDAFGLCFAIGSTAKTGGQAGDRVRAYYNFDSRRWEAISEGWMLQRFCKPNADIAKGATGTVSIYDGETDTGYDAETCKALGAAVTSAKWCIFMYAKQTKYVSPWECS